MDARIILPFDGTPHICRVNGSAVTPLVPMPGADDLRCFVNDAAGHVAVIDSQRKRVGLFDFLDEPPWVRQRLPFANLPKDCVAHTALPWDGGVLVGGHSKVGEALWARHPETERGSWQVIELPPRLRRPGKAIDGLHQDGDRLIAIDDIVQPKWLLVYAVKDQQMLELRRTVLLPAHTTYERIFDTCLGERFLWCASRGINHGNVSTHVWGLDRNSFKERVCWSFQHQSQQSWLPDIPGLFTQEEPEPAENPLVGVRAVVEWRGHLLLPTGKSGLYCVALAERSGEREETELRVITGLALAEIDTVVPHPEQDDLGVFAVGKDGEGVAAWQWLPNELIEA